MRLWLGGGWLLLVLLAAAPAGADPYDFDFDLTAFEPSPFSWGGYAEIKGEHFRLNQEGAFYKLRYYREPRSNLNRLSPAFQLEGSYRYGSAVLRGKARTTAWWDELGREEQSDLLEGYLSLTPEPSRSLDLGKKVTRWGTGYAFNPVGFVERPKDPDNPEESREGFVTAGLEFTQSRVGRLRTVSLSLVALPVTRELNEDFGSVDNLNLAANLYLLHRDTDINLLAFTGNSRSTRFGVAAGRNLQTNFTIHGELAHIPRQPFQTLQADGTVAVGTASVTSYLLGLRYLTARQLTIIAEYYHNGGGYRSEELDRFYDLVREGHGEYLATGASTTLARAASLASGYGIPLAGRDYLYTRLSWREPADILYFTPALTLIINLDDHSSSLSPEVSYTGFTNWEGRLRFTLLSGDGGSEYGEKANRHRLELRLRRFF
ncbi:MAG TPA: hypothetical protein ENN98_02635 [Desulfurivibrio alkaliphilus]|uniref:Phosphate-selective porin O and P n=1 Tax=Desulfurivibrio alkaliphilus TaxID=427923 RepID=A0A7C2XNB9_9BACT|nr:hypothetical protein [Desulfurivibrio alkaliphilus]